MSAVYTRTLLKADVTTKVSAVFTTANFDIVANNAVQEVLSDIDLRSTKRRTALSPNLFDDIYQYTCPSDLKEDKLVDLKPQLNRGVFDYWEFDI